MRITIVLTGYHFKNLEVYKKILKETHLNSYYEFDLYILSHKVVEDIPPKLNSYLCNNNWKIIFKNNIGWDWGCHVQFLQWYKDKNRKFDYALFLHDDIKIFKTGFIKEFVSKAEQGFELIGNSYPFTAINDFEKNYSDEAFILKKNDLNYSKEKIKIVRGSAFFISYNLANKALLNLPYQKCGDINMANRSLRMFGAVATKLVGTSSITYLSKDHFKSQYIIEEMRGKSVDNKFFIKRGIKRLFKKVYDKVNLFVSKYIYGFIHHSESDSKHLLKINISDKVIQGHLNMIYNQSGCSDITMEELCTLIKQGKIKKIQFTNYFNNPFNPKDTIKKVIEVVKESNANIDLLVAQNVIPYQKLMKIVMNHKDFTINKHLKIGKIKSSNYYNYYLRYNTKT